MPEIVSMTVSAQRQPSPPREPPETGFELLGPGYRLEEETWSWYNPEEYCPVRIGEANSKKLGFGSVSMVWLCRDLVEHEYVALKVFVSGNPQAVNEGKVFEHLKTIKSDHPGAKFTRKLRDSFELPGNKGTHTCLRELFDGEKLTPDLLKPVIFQVLCSLDYLHSQAKIVHTDIREEKIMMSIADKEILKKFKEEEWSEPSLRRIDGNHIIYAPRGLEIPDDFSDFVICDFGYAVFSKEKYTGKVMPDLYPRMIALLGPSPKDMLERGSWSDSFFDESGEFTADVEIPTTSLEEEMKSLEGEEKSSFLKCLRRMLRWKPEDRATAAELVEEPWIRSSLHHLAIPQKSGVNVKGYRK
ncbi:kinase-like protein [Hyaloscypha hepaticicola]|uniref:non-specific serine/threonine protein kinase n=1 Tax=Hyaloscypha hepaticicola TaxID=2082293 RepID=A0A2J6PGP0_9HELO|nr:kinase-like protein [Hyaloscypha hepaticicola]